MRFLGYIYEQNWILRCVVCLQTVSVFLCFEGAESVAIVCVSVLEGGCVCV